MTVTSLRYRGISMSIGAGLVGALLAAGASIAAEKTDKALTTFEVRQDGKVVKTWALSQVQKLPAAKFDNRRGKKRPAVLLSTLLERSGIPVERVAAVTVIGLGGDTKKGPSTKTLPGEKGPGDTRREFKDEGVAQSLAGAAIFYNVDKHWTLGDVERPDRAPWDQRRVRKVRHIDVTLKRP